ncbi:MAG: hypothetical protein QXV17_12385 [Candidatus Micrarchaeaceae archaeon]
MREMRAMIRKKYSPSRGPGIEGIVSARDLEMLNEMNENEDHMQIESISINEFNVPIVHAKIEIPLGILKRYTMLNKEQQQHLSFYDFMYWAIEQELEKWNRGEGLYAPIESERNDGDGE